MSIVVAVTSAVVNIDGTIRTIRKGEAWASDADVVQARPDLFTSDPHAAKGAPRPVEQATRAPGERSAARRVR